MALCSAAVIVAGTPGIIQSSSTLTESQDLVEQATLHQQAIALAHSLSDERGDMVEYVASGRTDEETAGATSTSDSQRARVDRQITELLASDAVVPTVRQSLEQLSDIRQETLTADGTAYDAFQAYTTIIQQLHGISRSVARGLPGGAAPGSSAAAAVATTESLPHLGRAVEQAAATRALLRGAFAGEGGQRTLTEAALHARVREQAALADFEQTADTTAGETYEKTVTGTDVGLAERYIEQLTEDPVLGPTDRALNTERVVSALSARVDRMRSVQSSMATAEVARMEEQRDDDVTGLELHVALVGACLLLALGVSVHTARSLARPLSVLRRGSQRLASAEEPDAEEPVRFHGRNDEFAEVVGALNRLRETAARLHTRAKEAEADNAYLVGTKDEATAERERLREECERLRERLETADGAAHGTFVHLGLRTLGLVERQLGLLEAMEAEESDPDELATLFKLDHLATRMRRAGENLLLLAGAEHAAPHHSGPVALLDVLRAAVSEIERYERVQIASLPPHAQVSGFAADDVSHLVAELLDNATSFSAPDSDVTLSAWMLENGEIMLSVQDEGIGVAADRLTGLNGRLGDPAAQDAPGTSDADGEGGLGNGLYVVARLAARHGLRVQLREQKQGGIAAVVVLPRALLPDRPTPGASGRTAAAADGGQSLPGSVAEANSNALPTRRAASAPSVPEEPEATGEPDEGDHPPAPDLPVRVPGTDPQTASWPSGPAADTTRGELTPTAASPASGDHARPPAEPESVDPLGGPPRAPGADEPPPAEPESADGPAGSVTVAGLPTRTPGAAPTAGQPPAGLRQGGSDESPVSFFGGPEHPDEARDTEPPSAAGGRQAAAVPAQRVEDEHTRAQDEGTEASHVRDEGGRVLTDKGLPKRTPRHVAAEQPARPQTSGGASAEELRRRLGGFQRGARDGHRDAAAEVTAQGAAGGGSTDEEAQH